MARLIGGWRELEAGMIMRLGDVEADSVQEVVRIQGAGAMESMGRRLRRMERHAPPSGVVGEPLVVWQRHADQMLLSVPARMDLARLAVALDPGTWADMPIAGWAAGGWPSGMADDILRNDESVADQCFGMLDRALLSDRMPPRTVVAMYRATVMIGAEKDHTTNVRLVLGRLNAMLGWLLAQPGARGTAETVRDAYRMYGRRPPASMQNLLDLMDRNSWPAFPYGIEGASYDGKAHRWRLPEA